MLCTLQEAGPAKNFNFHHEKNVHLHSISKLVIFRLYSGARIVICCWRFFRIFPFEYAKKTTKFTRHNCSDVRQIVHLQKLKSKKKIINIRTTKKNANKAGNRLVCVTQYNLFKFVCISLPGLVGVAVVDDLSVLFFKGFSFDI